MVVSPTSGTLLYARIYCNLNYSWTQNQVPVILGNPHIPMSFQYTRLVTQGSPFDLDTAPTHYQLVMFVVDP